MNFEKLGLYVFLKYYRQLDAAKGHLTASLRELLLAMSSSVEVAQNQLQEAPVLKHLDIVPGFLKKAQGLLEASVQFLPQPKIMRGKQGDSPETSRSSQYKRDVIEAIVDVIDEEMERLQKSSRPEVRLNLDALQAVKVVMLKHLGLEVAMADDHAPIDFPLAK